MSNDVMEPRKRNRTLLIVEGEREKEEIFHLLFRCFPEIGINMDNVWIYGTYIYQLYDDIAAEYGEEWADEEDIDLPFVVSKKKSLEECCYKKDFTNIILVFDYERHEPRFSEEKITKMQRCFNDAADMGKLYINYPMVESYLHLKTLPDPEYCERKIPVSLQPGGEYKSLVTRETFLEKKVKLYSRIDDLLEKKYGIMDNQRRNACIDKILRISDEETIVEKILETLEEEMGEKQAKTLAYQLKDWIFKTQYIQTGQGYWKYMREVFQQIIYHNVCKGNWILHNQYEIESDKYKDYYQRLDMTEILRVQNEVSADEEHGYIWILNTCVFFVAEYNFALVG